MTRSSEASPTIVIDAGVGLGLVLNLPYSPAARLAWQTWQAEGVELYAPSLWVYETTSALRKTWAVGNLTAVEATAALDTLLALEVQLVPDEDGELRRAALRWAARLNQRAAYDGFYLALADRFGTEFWSTDQRLVNGARQTGAAWVRWIGEAATSTPQNV